VADQIVIAPPFTRPLDYAGGPDRSAALGIVRSLGYAQTRSIDSSGSMRPIATWPG
jgi:hypothetical protein